MPLILSAACGMHDLIQNLPSLTHALQVQAAAATAIAVMLEGAAQRAYLGIAEYHAASIRQPARQVLLPFWHGLILSFQLDLPWSCLR